jgi:hypothetical protein
MKSSTTSQPGRRFQRSEHDESNRSWFSRREEIDLPPHVVARQILEAFLALGHDSSAAPDAKGG